MDTKRNEGGAPAAHGDDEINTTPILTPRLTEEEARVIAEYCRRYRASKGPAILVKAVEAMRADLARVAA